MQSLYVAILEPVFERDLLIHSGGCRALLNSPATQPCNIPPIDTMIFIWFLWMRFALLLVRFAMLLDRLGT